MYENGEEIIKSSRIKIGFWACFSGWVVYLAILFILTETTENIFFRYLIGGVLLVFVAPQLIVQIMKFFRVNPALVFNQSGVTDSARAEF